MMDRDSTSPKLLEPQLQRQAAPRSPVGTVLLAGGFMAAAATTVYLLGSAGHHGQAKPDAVIQVASSRIPGAFLVLDRDVTTLRPGLIATLKLSRDEKLRVERELKEGRIRLASVTLWDNVEEDGDIVDLTAAGFSQRLMLRKTPVTFHLPVIPGAPVRIVGVKDGGGGITLGVRTLLGTVPLPPLVPGQVIEVPAL
jgi:hypothetical protein